ncbi:DUF3515 domain-containing protein [Nocardiopsis trehalosi]|uniref:DUF3515 domain-containing protein n=1 Tax=Nocardiopsis trehalosi TaxID=109329 RepID=UPI001471C724|nr:DUF3515 domain-containing protein [Nocardiopsis trehalosi]
MGAALGVAVLAAGCAGAVRVPPPEPEGAAADRCAALVGRLPDTLLGADRAAVEPDSPYVAAWGDPPIAVRCGVERPEGLRPDSELMVVNDVAWLPQPADRPTLFTSVGREVYVEVTLPPSYGAPADGLVEVGGLVAEEAPPLPDGEL